MSKKPHPVIQDFLESRKAAKLKDKIKASMSDEQIQETTEKYEELFDYNNWISNNVENAWRIQLTTHPCKFSNPDSENNKAGKTTAVVFQSQNNINGYLYSTNTETVIDASCDAKYLALYNFLHLKIEFKTILDHLDSDSTIAKTNFSDVPGFTYDELKKSFLKIKESSPQPITNQRIKQVYFPVKNAPNQTEDYHLLSLISNSGLIFKMRKHLDVMHFSDETKALREFRKDGKHSSDSYSEVFGSVTIGYGGTKPQNISVLNSQNGGRAYLLASFPPELKKREVSFPTKDFFSQCINQRKLRKSIKHLDSYYKDTRNNMTVRESYVTIIQNIIDDLIITKMWQLREVAEEQYYEASSQLSSHQKIWLTEDIDTRLESDDWLDALMQDITTWILNSYRSIIGEDKFILMGESEHLQLAKLIQEQQTNLR